MFSESYIDSGHTLDSHTTIAGAAWHTDRTILTSLEKESRWVTLTSCTGLKHHPLLTPSARDRLIYSPQTRLKNTKPLYNVQARRHNSLADCCPLLPCPAPAACPSAPTPRCCLGIPCWPAPAAWPALTHRQDRLRPNLQFLPVHFTWLMQGRVQTRVAVATAGGMAVESPLPPLAAPAPTARSIAAAAALRSAAVGSTPLVLLLLLHAG
jgi:hypothetical protein